MITEPVLYKSVMIRRIRNMLDEEGYFEIMTPILRKFPGDTDRPRLQLTDGRWLRESPAFALRYNLQFAEAVYEMGASFRPDKLDSTHLPEFTMLDLYKRDATIDEVLNLAKRIVQEFYSGPVDTFSFANLVRRDFGIDLFSDESSSEKLVARFRELYEDHKISPLWLIDRYINENIEPLSKNRCLVVTDFPLLPEVRAKKRAGTAAIVDRFEILIDAIEVVHGYTDEDDADRFEAQARRLDSFGPEDQIMCDLLRRKVVPAASSGFGIGIERLCRTALKKDSVEAFRTSHPFSLD